MLNITDLSLLKITKVKQWAICFDYGNEHYLIHGQHELGEGSGQTLYQRTLDENGNYELFEVASQWYLDDNVEFDYIRRQRGQTVVYSQIDKEFFAYKLTKNKLALGVMEEQVKKDEEYASKIKEEIRELNKRASLLQTKLYGVNKWGIYRCDYGGEYL